MINRLHRFEDKRNFYGRFLKIFKWKIFKLFILFYFWLNFWHVDRKINRNRIFRNRFASGWHRTTNLNEEIVIEFFSLSRTLLDKRTNRSILMIFVRENQRHRPTWDLEHWRNFSNPEENVSTRFSFVFLSISQSKQKLMKNEVYLELLFEQNDEK